MSFGEPADTALPLLEQSLGRQPAGDRTETGDLPGGYGGRNATVRFVDFGGLSLVFTDWPYYRDDGVVHLIAWWAGDGWTTPEGIRLGSKVDDLHAAYGDQLRVPMVAAAAGGDHRAAADPAELRVDRGDQVGHALIQP